MFFFSPLTIPSSSIDCLCLSSGTYKILNIHYHFILGSFDPHAVVLHILFYSSLLLTYVYIHIYIYIYICIAALSDQLISLYICICVAMKLTNQKGHGAVRKLYSQLGREKLTRTLYNE